MSFKLTAFVTIILLVIVQSGLIIGAEELTCKSYQFQCHDGSKCLEGAQECDLIIDCPDGSDEEDHCNFFTCHDNSAKISFNYLCDEFPDCDDESDESKEFANCTKFTCADGKEINPSFICDGLDDCNDKFRSDECNCTDTFLCTNMKCVANYLKCDGVDDCGDESDELTCEKFTCDNGHVLMKHMTCNGQDDCGDHSDECSCPDIFRCANGKCINNSLKDDGNDDCGDNSDEALLSTTKAVNNVTMAPTVVTSANKLTTRPKGTVETNSTAKHVAQPVVTIGPYPDVTTASAVERDEFKCKNYESLSTELLCDGKDDCKDGFASDECNCTYSFVCDNSKCIHQDQACDGMDDCGDCSEEIGCKVPGSDIEIFYVYYCQGSGVCVRDEKLCDGVQDCIEGDDEDKCDDITHTTTSPDDDDVTTAKEDSVVTTPRDKDKEVVTRPKFGKEDDDVDNTDDSDVNKEQEGKEKESSEGDEKSKGQTDGDGNGTVKMFCNLSLLGISATLFYFV